MHRSRTLALIACGAALAPAAPAAGDVPLRDDPRASAVALSGPDARMRDGRLSAGVASGSAIDRRVVDRRVR